MFIASCTCAFNAIIRCCSSSALSAIAVTKMSDMYSNIVYKSLDSVLEHLKNPKFADLKQIPNLLQVYNEAKQEEGLGVAKKYPFIVLEGLDGCGKSTATKRLASTLDGALLCTPPESMRNIRDDFDSPEYKEVRTAYYALGNYIAAINIATVLQTRPVVLDRFWHSTVAYALAQAIKDYPEIVSLPAEDDPILNWPEDLLKPDLVCYLCVNEEVRLQRLKNRTKLTDQEEFLEKEEKFRKDVVFVYNNVKPKMKYVNAQLSKRKLELDIMKHVEPLLLK